MSITPESLHSRGIERVDDETEAAAEQADVHKSESPDAAVELPEQEIAHTIEEINAIDEEVYAAQRSIAETNTKLSSLRESMGMPPDEGNAPAVGFQDERIKDLERRKKKLNDQKERWVQRWGGKNFPDGIAMGDGDGGRGAKGGSFEDRRDRASDQDAKKEEMELRSQWFKELEGNAVKNFEQAIRQDWQSKDAMNLELTIELMKVRVPELMEKEADDFLNGKVDEPPFSALWVHWQILSPLDRILGKPNQIANLNIVFDNEPRKLADDRELTEAQAQSSSEDKKPSR